MFKRLKIIKKIKNLREKSVSEKFLSVFRIELESYVKKNPVPLEAAGLFKEKQKIWFPTKLKLAQVSLVAVLMVIISGAGITFASQRSLPGEKLYPVKILSEEIRIKLTPKTESKMKLRAEFAEERVREIREIVKKEGTDSLALNIGLSQAEQNFFKTAEIVKEEKNKGKNVKELAKTASDNLESGVLNLKNVFREKGKNLKAKERELKTNIGEAQKSANAPSVEEFKKELEKVRLNQQIFETKKEDVGKSFADEKEWINKQIDIKEVAQKAVKNMEIEKGNILNEAKDAGVILEPSIFNKFDDFIKKAKSDFESGNYKKSIKDVKSAEDSLVEIKKAVKELEVKNSENNNINR